MGKLTETPGLNKFAAEIIFRPTTLTLADLPHAAATVEGRFKEWKADKGSQIFLYDEKKKNSLRLTHGTVAYVEEKSNEGEMVRCLNKTMHHLVQESRISELRRLGVRTIRSYATPFKYEELVKILYGIFYSKNENLKNISTSEPKDIIYVLRGEKNGFENNVTIAPTAKEETVARFDSGFPEDKTFIEGHVQEANIYFDIDVFCDSKTDLTITNYERKLEEAIAESQRLIADFIKEIDK